MKIFPYLRVFARIAKAMERANELKEKEMGIKRLKGPSKIDFSVASWEERNKAYRRERDPFQE